MFLRALEFQNLFFFFLALSLGVHSLAWGDGKERGKNLYRTCVGCHGERGEGDPSQKTPKIAGQHGWFIVEAIEEFRKGKKRKSPKMLPSLKNLSQRDIQDLAVYIASLKAL